MYLYEGSTASGTAVVEIIGVSGDTSKVVEACLNPTIHTLVMTDTYGDGWTTGSSVTISVGTLTIGTYRLSTGTSTTVSVVFENLFLYGGNWKYTNEAQSSTGWTTQTVSWTEGSSFPAVTTTTRYFRRTLTIGSFDSAYYMMIKVKTNTGFLLYINGQEAWNWNMPDTVTSSTYANSATTDVVERSFSTLLKLWATSTTCEIGIEVHATADTVSGDETFDAQIIIASGADISCIDTDGTFSASPLSTGTVGTASIFDGSTSTKWCFPHSSGNVLTTWIFNNGRRETVNRYSISSANDTPARDPVAWNLYGSFDGEDFYLLDSQSNINWSARYETKTFTIGNIIAFNQYRLEITEKAGTDSSMQFSEWNLLASNQPVVAVGLSYPQSTYVFSKNIDTVNIRPTLVGFTGFTITPALPEGLTFNANSGRITGVPTASQDATTYSIQGTHLFNGQSYTATLTISVVGCDLPTGVYAQFTKTNGALTTENFQVFNSNNELVLNGVGGDESTITATTCLTVGTYTVKMLHSSGSTWSSSSFLTIEYIINGVAFTVSRSRLSINSENSFSLVADFVLPFADTNTGIKYLADNSVPANWYSTSFDASSWTTLQNSNRPSVGKLQLYRTTFNVASVTGFDGFELNVKAQAGIVVYLNGNEIYRRYIAAGDISTSSEATGGMDAAYWRSVTGRMSQLTQGTNTLAVAIVRVSSVAAASDFDVALRLLKDSNVNPRYWGTTATSNTGSASEIIDQNPTTKSRISKNSLSAFTVAFENTRAEFFNRYCFITSPDSSSEDPRDWTISGSNDNTNWDVLKTETNVYFEMRATEYCFFMPNAAKAYTYFKLAITETCDTTAMYIGLADLTFYLEDLDHATVPELTFSPSVLVGYTGADFPEVTASSPYYTSFTISPALPTGLVMSSNTGSIKGVLEQPYATTIHTISAINHLGETKSTTVSVTVEICAGDMVSFSLVFTLESGASLCSFDLKDLTSGDIVESRPYLIDYQTFTIPMCRTAGKYALILKKSDTSGWGSNRVTVRLADGAELLTESLAAGVTSKEYNFNVRYEIAPLFSTWNYLVDGSVAPEGWNTVSGAPGSWESAMPGSFPVATGVTQYYYKKFTTTSMSEYSVLEISVTTRAGMIVYLNGEKIHSMNMRTYDIDSTVPATTELTVPVNYVIGIYVLSEQLVEGENILAIEMHRYQNNEAVNSFDASAILVLDNMYMVKDGIGTTSPATTGGEGSDKAFDNNSSTKFLASQCVGVTLTWAYNNDRREPITNYGLVSANDCNTRHPSGWTLHGSNDGTNWILLHTATNVVFTEYYQQKRFDFYNQYAYNQYKVTTTECQNEALEVSSSCGSGMIQLADYYLFAKRVVPDCNRLDDFPPAMIGDYSYASCPEQYSGVRFRICTADGFLEETNQCVPESPKGIQYTESNLVLTQGVQMTPLTPTIIGKEVTVTIFPILPSGLQIDQTTGTISGTPNEVQEQRKYTISVKNKGGSTSTTMTITVEEKPTNWMLIIVLVVVAIVVIVVGIVGIVALSKKKKPTKKMPSTKSSKTTKTATAVKTKGNIKV